MSSEAPLMIRCELCGNSFQFGAHIYRGKVISAYKLTLCDACYGGNWDGYAPHYETILEAHWKMHGITSPRRNSRGLYPRGD